MNYLPYVTLVGWETRNWRHRDKALVWCKDYGFTPITRHVFVGEIYTKERMEMRKKFEGLFTKKTEKFFFATMCKSCFTEGMIGVPILKKIRALDKYELIQMPKNP
ncbi:MAG: hypothetical protein P4L61_04190 [Candidatus Pacebacteria bacterium]|nr:hypothetical protein [Candidatus Paceibacterota bacterium]